MRTLHRRKRHVLTHNPFNGLQGACLYIGAAGVDDPSQIEFRHIRILTSRICDTGALFSQENIGLTSHVELVKSPTTSMSVTLSGDYADATFWVQARPHKEGIELPTLWRSQRIVADGGGDLVNQICGLGVVYEVLKLVDGGMRVRFGWSPILGGLDPQTFVIHRVSGPTSPADVSIDFVANQFAYSIDVAGLQNAGAYVFRLSAARDDAPSVVIAATINFTADADGPDVGSLSYEEL
jgi:hypothetical protein